MAQQLLSGVPAIAVAVLTACQVGPIAVVDCRDDGDCVEGDRCDPEDHACVQRTPPGENENPPDGPPLNPVEPIPSTYTGNLLTWGNTGVVFADQNPFGIAGTWFLYDDCSDVSSRAAAGKITCPSDAPTPQCCTARDPSLIGPPPALDPGFSFTGGVVGVSSGTACVRGRTAKLLEGSDTGQWGAGFALNLANWAAFDATRAFPGGTIKGFAFDIDGSSTGDHPLRAGISTARNQRYFKTLSVPTKDASILFDAPGPGFFGEPEETLDLTSITNVTLEIEPGVDGPVPFDFCVSNVRVLQDPASTPASPMARDTLLAWDERGSLLGNPPGFDGGWGRVDDCTTVAENVAAGTSICPADAPTAGCCTEWDHALVGPPPDALPGLSVESAGSGGSSGRICVKGRAARVEDGLDGSPDYGTEWGAVIELLLLDEGFVDGPALGGGALEGFKVDLEGPATGLTIEAGISTGSVDWYFLKTPLPVRDLELRLADLKQGDYVMPQVSLDATHLSSLKFQVTAITEAATPFEFCVTNVRAIQASAFAASDK